jgi:hypothetical protein
VKCRIYSKRVNEKDSDAVPRAPGESIPRLGSSPSQRQSMPKVFASLCTISALGPTPPFPRHIHMPTHPPSRAKLGRATHP